jgi:general L-amino acid transport system permease protein
MSDTHAQTAFVRTEMLPEQTPPVTQTGAIKWLRENLFSSWVNAILTLISLYVIYWVISHISFWMFNGIWEASSLSECREIRDATFGEGGQRRLLGRADRPLGPADVRFLPAEFYWRPILALVLFLVAISPVLYDNLPRKMLLFTVISPFVLFWLLWGGTIWGPIAVAAGFVLAWAVLTFAHRSSGSSARSSRRSSCRSSTGCSLPVPRFALGSAIPIGIEFVPSDDFGGFMLAFVIGIAGIILSLPLGIVLALGRQSDLFIINKFSVIFIEVIRGVPLIVWLFTASLLLNYFLPPGTNFDLMLRVIIMVTLFASAYIAEVIRGGLAALPRAVRGGRQPRARLLAVDAADHPAAGAEDLDPRHRQHLHRAVQGHHAGRSIIGLLDPVGHVERDPRHDRLERDLLGALHLHRADVLHLLLRMSRYSQWLERKLRTDHR